MTPEYDTSLSARSLARIAFITFVAFAIAVSLLGATSVFAQENSYQSGTFTGQTNLNGSQEVPTRSTNMYGNFSLTSPDNASATYTLVYNATSSVTGAHIHCGAPGQNGPVIVPLSSSGTITDSVIQDQTNCPTPIYDLDDLKQAIRNGHAYVNVHTTTYPDGEIRGNLTGSYAGGSGNGNDCEWKNDCKDDHGYDNDKWKNDHDGCDKDWTGWNGRCWCDKGHPDYSKDHNGYSKHGNKDGNHDWDKDWDSDRDWDKKDGHGNNDWDKKDDYKKDWNNDWDKKDDHSNDWNKKDDWKNDEYSDAGKKNDEYSDAGKKNDWNNDSRWDRDWDRGDHNGWNDGKNDDHDYDRGSGVNSYLRVGNGVTGYVSIGN